MPALPATPPFQGEDAFYASNSYTNVMVDVYLCIAMACGDAVVQLYQFDPKLDIKVFISFWEQKQISVFPKTISLQVKYVRVFFIFLFFYLEQEKST